MNMDGPAAHRTEPPGHVDVEDLAALVDKQLSEEECAQVRAHLAECEDCYEIFADMVRFLEAEEAEEGKAGPDEGRDGAEIKRFPFSDAWRGSVRRWLPQAAAAILVLGGWVGYRAAFSAPPVTIAGTSDYLPSDVGPRDLVPQDVPRGGEQTDPLAFRVGVEVVDLQAALKSGHVELAKGAAEDVARLFFQNDFYVEFYQYYSALGQRLSAENLPELAAESVQYADGELREGFEPLILEFGIWAEAARLAAETGQPGFFQDRRNRRALSRFARNKTIEEDTRKLLRGLEKPWESRTYPALAEQLKEIVRSEYRRSG